jgi:hypothetical protein
VKRYARDIIIARPPTVVFDFFADFSGVPRWAPEDFISADRMDNKPIGLGSRFKLVTKGANATAVFTWDVFDRPRELRFSSPRLDVGPGWVEGSGGYTFRVVADGTLVTAWYQPMLGGLLALMSPFARMRNVRLLARQLDRAKALIEAAPPG